jgi:hypothetical protein
MRKITTLFTSFAVSFVAVTMAHAQSNDPNQLEQAPFASENAIIDTSIPFAIGAREAQQSLRGSFGWPTFQEGLVQGVYFRFDPDGYARFAPTPRLDTDVFEVICRPRTYSCMGRKGALSLILNSRGQLQVKIDDALSGDRFFVSEGVSEIEVPERILQPLDTQLELLLSSGGDLIVRRGDNEKDRISLTGFLPVSSYLRWVAARQDYTILPRGWPIPNAAGSEGGVTQATNWQSPMPQPQNFPVGQKQIQQPQQQLRAQVQSAATVNAQSEVDEVKTELKVLRQLLLERNKEPQAVAQNQMQPNLNVTQGSIAQLMPKATTASPVTDQIAELQRASAQIQADLLRLSQPAMQPTPEIAGVGLTTQTQDQQSVQQTRPVGKIQPQDPAIETAKRLQYLMSEIGLDAKTALMLIQMGDSGLESRKLTNQSEVMQATSQITPIFKDNVVAQILKELESDVLVEQPKPSDTQSRFQNSISENEYLLLSQYFKSVVMP